MSGIQLIIFSNESTHSVPCHSVFIGKLRGRVKVAVCEFRDELSESTSNLKSTCKAHAWSRV